MKNKQITLAALAVGLLAGCMPEKNAILQGSKPSATPLRFVVTQPVSREGAKEIVSALSESLTAIAKASNGATVQIPEIRILRGNGKDGLITVTGVAPSGLGVVLFGDQTPSAKKELLSNTLAALDSALRSGAQGKPVDVGTIEASAKIVFKGYTFTTFVPGGGSIPWESKAVGPVPVIDDRGVFMQKVVADQSGGFLVLADPDGSKA